MLIITQSYNNNVTSIQTFASEREAIEHFLQIVSEEEGTDIFFSDDVFNFHMVDSREFATSITYNGGGEDSFAVQLFGVENVNQYVRNWDLRVYLERKGKHFSIKDRSEHEAIKEAEAIMRDLDEPFDIILDWSLMPKGM